MALLIILLLVAVAIITVFGRVNCSLLVNASCPSIYSCANCTAVRLCNPDPFGLGFIEYKTANCTRDAPYCDELTGTCATTPTIECAVTREIICLRDGIFPYSTDCSKYFICTNLQSISIKCPYSYYYYNSDTEKCITNKGCFSFNCNNRIGYKVPYPNDPSIYTYCINNAATLVNRCNGKDELNSSTQQCEPVCHYDGLIPDTTDCTRYYRCNKVLDKTRYQITSLKCPSGQAFSEYEYQCLPASQVPSCNTYTTSALPITISTTITTAK